MVILKKAIELYFQGGYPVNVDNLVKAYGNQGNLIFIRFLN